MALWLIEPTDKQEKSNPWDPWYDKVFGMVIRAKSEEEARKIASKEGLDETNWDGGNPWLDKRLTTCKEISNTGKSGLILRDMANG